MAKITTITVTEDIVEELKKRRIHDRQPLREVIQKLLEDRNGE